MRGKTESVWAAAGVTLALLVAGSAFGDPSAPPIKFGDASYFGTGCPEGRVSVTFAPDNTALTLLFEKFRVRAGGERDFRKEKECTLFVPLKLKKGVSLALLKGDIRGFINIPVGGRAVVASTYGLIFSDGTVKQKEPLQTVYHGEMIDEFMISDPNTLRFRSTCGGQHTLIVNLRIRGRTNTQNDEVEVILDSYDSHVAPGERNMTFQMQLTNCT